MKVDVNGKSAHYSTGGREHKDGAPTIIFMHGAGQSRLTWPLQVRVFAYDGYNVVAPDFPGHGLSEGEPLASVEEQAQWVLALMDALKLEKAHVVGHSQGGLVAIELSSVAADRIASIALVATAGAIPVNQALIDMSENTPAKANAMLVSWGSGPEAHHHENTLPGISLITTGLRIMEQNPPQALTADFKACAAYDSGMEKAAKISVPSVCVFAAYDKLTPLKLGRKLAEIIPGTQLHEFGDCGHMLPSERPQELNEILRAFYKSYPA